MRHSTGLLAYYLNVYIMIYFKIKLQFKFRKNKIYSYIIVNFHVGLCYKIHCRKNKNYHEKMTAGWYTVISLFLKPLEQHFVDVTPFRLSKSRYSLPILFKHHSNFVLFLQTIWIVEFMRPNS